jgi:hypothetical protein
VSEGGFEPPRAIRPLGPQPRARHDGPSTLSVSCGLVWVCVHGQQTNRTSVGHCPASPIEVALEEERRDSNPPPPPWQGVQGRIRHLCRCGNNDTAPCQQWGGSRGDCAVMWIPDLDGSCCLGGGLISLADSLLTRDERIALVRLGYANEPNQQGDGEHRDQPCPLLKRTHRPLPPVRRAVPGCYASSGVRGSRRTGDALLEASLHELTRCDSEGPPHGTCLSLPNTGRNVGKSGTGQNSSLLRATPRLRPVRRSVRRHDHLCLPPLTSHDVGLPSQPDGGFGFERRHAARDAASLLVLGTA